MCGCVHGCRWTSFVCGALIDSNTPREVGDKSTALWLQRAMLFCKQWTPFNMGSNGLVLVGGVQIFKCCTNQISKLRINFGALGWRLCIPSNSSGLWKYLLGFAKQTLLNLPKHATATQLFHSKRLSELHEQRTKHYIYDCVQAHVASSVHNFFELAKFQRNDAEPVSQQPTCIFMQQYVLSSENKPRPVACSGGSSTTESCKKKLEQSLQKNIK